MLSVLRAKFGLGSRMARGLLATEDAFLLEHNDVCGRDATWSDNQDGSGQNWLGLQLMLVRDELREEERRGAVVSGLPGNGGTSGVNAGATGFRGRVSWTAFLEQECGVDLGQGLDKEAENGRWQGVVRAATNTVLSREKLEVVGEDRVVVE